MENKKTLEQVQQLKLNVTNIHSFLVKENKRKKKLASNKEKEEKKKLSIKKSKERERKLETRRKVREDQVYSGAQVSPKEGNIFEKLLEFGALVLSGILVNALPKIIEEVKKIVDAIVNFVTPIQSGFNLIKAFFEGDIDKSKYDADKKRVDGELEKISGKGGLIDQLAEKAGPLEGIIKSLRPAVDRLLRGKGAKNIVLAKKGGKEGVLNKETGEFTERQFTSAEREQYEGKAIKGSVGTDYLKDEGESVSAAGETSGGKISGYPITSNYGYRTHPVTGEAGKLHGGIDIGTPTGTSISLAEDGEIVAAGEYGGYGYMIDAWLPSSGVQIRLAHLSEIIKRSGTFKANEILGKTGGAAGSRGAGSSTGPHLHFEADTIKGSGRYGGSGNPSDYAKLLLLGSSQPNKKSSGKGGVISPIASTPKEKIATINQTDPRKRRSSTTLAVQQVNTIQYLPYMMPMPVASKSFASSQPTELSSIWRA